MTTPTKQQPKKQPDHLKRIIGKDKWGTPLRFDVETRLDAYQPWFDKYGKQHGVDPELLRAVARMESQGLPEAKSPTGPVGLMQFTVATAAHYGLKQDDRKDPEKSIDAAARHMLDLLVRYKGDTVKALAAYNQGEGHVNSRKGDLTKLAPEAKRYVKGILGVDVAKGYSVADFVAPGFERFWQRDAKQPTMVALSNPKPLRTATVPPGKAQLASASNATLAASASPDAPRPTTSFLDTAVAQLSPVPSAHAEPLPTAPARPGLQPVTPTPTEAPQVGSLIAAPVKESPALEAPPVLAEKPVRATEVLKAAVAQEPPEVFTGEPQRSPLSVMERMWLGGPIVPVQEPVQAEPARMVAEPPAPIPEAVPPQLAAYDREVQGKPILVPVPVNPLERAVVRGALATKPTRPEIPQDTIIAEEEEPPMWDVAGAWWRKHTVVGSLVGYGIRGAEAQLGIEEGFNPYSYYEAYKEEFPGLAPHIYSGHFETVINEPMFRARAAALLKEDADEKLIEEGGFLGTAAGMVALLPEATLIPGGSTVVLTRSTGALARFGMGLRVGAVSTAAQESALHLVQSNRTDEESAIQIGAGALSSGVFASLFAPGRTFARAAADNPLMDVPGKAAQEETIIARPGERVSEASERVGGADSVGAMRAAEEADTEMAKGTGLTQKILDMLEPVTKRLSEAAGPVSRSLHYSSGVAREITQGIYDLGGAITKGAAQGRPITPTVEDLSLDIQVGLRVEKLALQGAYFKMQEELGAKGGSLGISLGADAEQITGGLVKMVPIPESVLHEVVRRHLVDGGNWSDANKAWLEETLQQRGLQGAEASRIVLKHALPVVETMQKENAHIESELIRLGLLDKDKALGKEYGLPQLWNPQWILDNQEEARRIFTEILGARPEEEWLSEAHKMTLKDFDALPLGDPKRAEILAEWSGDQTQAAVETAKLRVAEAQ